MRSQRRLVSPLSGVNLSSKNFIWDINSYKSTGDFKKFTVIRSTDSVIGEFSWNDINTGIYASWISGATGYLQYWKDQDAKELTLSNLNQSTQLILDPNGYINDPTQGAEMIGNFPYSLHEKNYIISFVFKDILFPNSQRLIFGFAGNETDKVFGISFSGGIQIKLNTTGNSSQASVLDSPQYSQFNVLVIQIENGIIRAFYNGEEKTLGPGNAQAANGVEINKIYLGSRGDGSAGGSGLYKHIGIHYEPTETPENIMNDLMLLHFNRPNAITNLSIGTKYSTGLQLIFTPPSSVNAIDYYEVYVDGVFYKEITVSGDYITGLEPDTPYSITVKAVDIYYNKSEFSNSVSDTTNATEPYPINNIISYYKLEGNALDFNNVNNGTPTAITYEEGLVGQRAIFNGSTSRIILTNNASLQLSQGSIVTIINSTNAGSGYRGIVIKQRAYGLFLASGVLVAYSWESATGIAAGEKSTGINLNDGLNHVIALTFNAGVVNGTKVYLDGNLVLTTSIAIDNQTQSLVIGAGTSDSIIQQINAKIDDSAVFNSILTAVEVSEITSKLQSGQSLI